MKGIGSAVEGLENAMEKAEGSSKALLAGVGALGAGIVAFGGIAVSQLADIEQINARLEHGLDATGMTAFTSAEAIGDYATELQYKTGIEHESIRSAMSQVGAMENVKAMFESGEYSVEDYMDTTADLATFWETDFANASSILSRYLEDPASAISRLERRGISLTDAQQEQIETMTEAGDTAGAQGVLLDALTSSTEGLAEANNDTLNGSLTTMKMAFDDVWQAVVDNLGIMDSLRDTVDTLRDNFLDFAGAIEDKGVAGALRDLIPENLEPMIFGVAGAISMGLVPSLYAKGKALLFATASLAPFLLAGAALGALAYTIYDNWSFFEPFFSSAFEVVGGIVEGFRDTFMNSWETLKASGEPIIEAVKSAIDSLGPIIELVGVIIGAFLVTAMATFNGLISAIGPVIEAFFNLVEFVSEMVQWFVALLTGDWEGAQQHWENMIDSSLEFVMNLWEGIKNFFTGFVDTFLSILSNFGIDLKQGFIDMWESAKDTVSSGIDSVIDFFSSLPADVMSFITKLASDLVQGFMDMLSDGKNAVSDGIDTIIETVTGFGSSFLDAGKGLITGFTDGIKSAFTGARDAVSDGLSTVRNLLPFSPAKEGPLEDLDKSGESFFPTWYESALSGVGAMGREIGGAMGDLNDELQSGAGEVELAFGAGRQQHKFTIDVSGEVKVSGDGQKSQSIAVAQKEVVSNLEGSDFLKNMKQSFRKY